MVVPPPLPRRPFQFTLRALIVFVIAANLACAVYFTARAAFRSGPLETFRLSRAPLTAGLVTADGERLLAGGADGRVELWSLSPPARLAQFTGHASGVNAVAFVAEIRRVASWGEDLTLRLWDPADQAAPVVLSGDAVRVRFTPDGGRALAAHADGNLRVWDLAAGALAAVRPLPEPELTALALAPDARYALTGHADGTLRVWDLEADELKTPLTGHAGAVRAAEVFADGRWALTGGDDGRLRLWSLAAPAAVREFDAGGAGRPVAIEEVVGLGEEEYAGALLEGGSLRLWRLADGRELERLGRLEELVVAVVGCPDRRRLLVSDAAGRVHVWDLRSDQLVRRLDTTMLPSPLRGGAGPARLTPGGAARRLFVTHGGARLVALDADGRCLRWRLTEVETWPFYLSWSLFIALVVYLIARRTRAAQAGLEPGARHSEPGAKK